MISFSKRVLIASAFIFLSGIAIAQGQKIEEGFDYRVLPVPQPVETKGKVEVIEFFWYGCPHCYDFEPELSAWVKRQPKDVAFRRVPVAFRDDFLPHSQLFYALEAMGKGDAVAGAVGAGHGAHRRHGAGARGAWRQSGDDGAAHRQHHATPLCLCHLAGALHGSEPAARRSDGAHSSGK